MSELIDIFKALISKTEWSKITSEEKEKNFFIVNRYLSKKYIESAQLFNLKTIDKVSAMNLWHHFMKDKPYPSWFWSKSEKSEKSEIPEKYYKLLLERLKVKDIDLDYLIEHHLDFIKDELGYYKKFDKQ